MVAAPNGTCSEWYFRHYLSEILIGILPRHFDFTSLLETYRYELQMVG